MADDTDELIAVINGLSNDAVYMASLPYFSQVLKGHPILAKADTPRQQEIFDELLEVGFVHGDVERGIFGYRSTHRGRMAAPYCRAAMQGPSA